MMFLSHGVFRCEYGGRSNGSANKVELKGPDALRWRLGRRHYGRIGARSRGNPRLAGLRRLPTQGSDPVGAARSCGSSGRATEARCPRPDVAYWHFSVVCRCPLNVGYRGQPGHSAESPEGPRLTHNGPQRWVIVKSPIVFTAIPHRCAIRPVRP
jgi:hypothetical protein